MLREADRCAYCGAPIQIGEGDFRAICSYCGREMEVAGFIREEKRLIEVVEDARRSSEAAAEEVRRKVEALSRAYSSEMESAVNLARNALETCKTALESVKGKLDRSEARKLHNLFAQGEEAQRAGRFEDAERWYRQVLVCAENEAEVHWRLVLCGYGVEYVREQASGRYLPTISHMVVDSVLENVHYGAAVRLARSEEIRRFYEEEARHIDGILDKYRQITATETPYDVFISVKQGDEDGNPTNDSLLAQDLYYMLTNEFGLKVFNSRISLSQYAGFEYEPYIMAALMRAKVMIVVGTKREYMTSAWVRNEWRRFRWLKDNEDDSRRLIAYVSGMHAGEIPREMGVLQAIRAENVGSGDVLRGVIKAVFGGDKDAEDQPNPLLERAAMYLEDGEFDQAERCCERVLDRDPRSAQAYVLKLCVHCKARKEEQLAEAQEPLDALGDYKRALRFGDESMKRRLESYNEAVRERLKKQPKKTTEQPKEAPEQPKRASERPEVQLLSSERLDKKIQTFETKKINSATDALKLNSQIQQYVAKEKRFEEYENGSLLLQRCNDRMDECLQIYQKLKAEEDRRVRDQEATELNRKVDVFLQRMQACQVRNSVDFQAVSDAFSRFIEANRNFSDAPNAEELRRRCRTVLDSKRGEMKRKPADPAPLSRMIRIALVYAVIGMALYIVVGGTMKQGLLNILLPVFGVEISVLTGIPAIRQRKPGKALLALAALVVWIAYAVHVHGINLW